MQEETNEPIDDEVARLKACINDLTSLLALPAIFTGREPHEIITALLDVLMGILRLDTVYAEVKDPASGAPINMMRAVLSEDPTVGRLDIKQALNNWLKEDFRASSIVLKQSTGDVSIVPLRLGFQNELGWVVAASRRVDFPTETEKLLLNVATNQTSIGLQEAWLLSEQKRIARKLDEKIAERTRELQILKDELQRENVMLREQLDEASMFEEIVGTAPVLRSVLSRVAKVAPTDSTILITGETGTGKELIARPIHKRSARSAHHL
jgi:Sigma-54 interaction domain